MQNFSEFKGQMKVLDRKIIIFKFKFIIDLIFDYLKLSFMNETTFTQKFISKKTFRFRDT